MDMIKVHQKSLLLVGISQRTSFQKETSQHGLILPTVQTYHQQEIASQLNGRINPGVTYCAYTDYASDEYGEYTFFIGEAVDPHATQPSSLTSLIVPEGPYQKLTTDPKPMPQVIIDAWRTIWSMDWKDQRTYQVDFEIYDQRAANLDAAIVDVLVGVKK